MDIFNINEEMIFNTIDSAMREAEANLTEQQIYKIVNAIDGSIPGLIEILIENTSEYWKDSASSINGWGAKYAEAIKTNIGEKEGSVYVDESQMVKVGKKQFKSSVFVKKIEEGVRSWSIRDALMKSEKAKTGKDGIKYITILFPVATPRKKTQGKQLSKFGGREMSSEIHKLVKSGGKAPKGTFTSSGINISGLTKYETTQFHEGYGIYRRVSKNSLGWQYPDKSPVPVYDSVKQYVDKRINEIIHKFCVDLIKEYS